MRRKLERRTRPCPSCGKDHRLTPAQARAGYLCPECCQAFALAAPLLTGPEWTSGSPDDDSPALYEITL